MAYSTKYKLTLKDLGVDIPKDKRQDALEEAATLLKETLLDYIGGGNSPVSGHGKFKGYTKEYKEFKNEYSSAGSVNLEFSGEMLDALDVIVSGNGLEIGVFGGDDVQGKAEGNNLGTYGKQSPIPGKARRFIPLEDEELKRPILSKLKSLLSEFEDD